MSELRSPRRGVSGAGGLPRLPRAAVGMAGDAPSFNKFDYVNAADTLTGVPRSRMRSAG